MRTLSFHLLAGCLFAGLFGCPAEAPEPTVADPDPAPKQKVVHLATFELPPYCGAKLEGQGYATEVVRAAFAHEGYAVEVRFSRWDEAMELAKSGEVQVAGPAYFTKQRSIAFVYSDPYPGGPIGFYKRVYQDIEVDGIESLKGLRIGVVWGYANTDAFDRARHLDKTHFRADVDGLRALVEEDIDVLLTERNVGRFLLATELAASKGDVEFIEPPLEDKPVYCIFPKNVPGHEELRDAFDRGLAKARAEGQIEALRKKHGLAP